MSKHTQRLSNSTLVLSWVLLFTAIIVFSASTLYRYYARKDFPWALLVLELSVLVGLNANVMWQSWKRRNHMSASYNIFALAWGASTFWYWTIAPLYGYFTMSFNSQQLAVNGFSFIWEVPVFGSISFAISHMLFRPIQRYINKGFAENPQKLYRRVKIFPLTVALQNLFFSLQGYVFGTLQQHQLGHMPAIEQYKNLGNGVVIGLLLTLFYYFVFDYYLIPIRTKIIRQYDIQNVKTKHFYRRVIGILMFVTISSLTLMVLVYVQSFQHLIHERLANEGYQEVKEYVDRAQHDKSAQPLSALEMGDSSKSAILELDAPLPIDNVSEQTKEKFQEMQDGDRE